MINNCLFKQDIKSDSDKIYIHVSFFVITILIHYYELYYNANSYIQGLYLEGAYWNRESGQLDEPKSGILHDKLPVICIEPCKIQVWRKL